MLLKSRFLQSTCLSGTEMSAGRLLARDLGDPRSFSSLQVSLCERGGGGHEDACGPEQASAGGVTGCGLVAALFLFCRNAAKTSSGGFPHMPAVKFWKRLFYQFIAPPSS